LAANIGTNMAPSVTGKSKIFPMVLLSVRLLNSLLLLKNIQAFFSWRVNMGYLYLTVAIIAEVIATNALKASDEFTKLLPSVVVVIGYGIAFYCLSLVLKTIPVGVTYAIWSGLGIVLITVVAAIVFRQIPDVPAIIGMVLIIAGVVVMNVFSKTVVH